MLAVTAYPIVYALWLSLQRYNLASPADTKFIWFENYQTILTDRYWWTAFVITLVITVISVAIEFALGMVNGRFYTCVTCSGFDAEANRWANGVTRLSGTSLYIAAVLRDESVSMETMIQRYLLKLERNTAALRAELMGHLGIIILAEVWKTTPFMALLLLAGLALVPEDLLRAAQMDGAGPWKRLIKVTLPLIKPAILVALLFRTLDAFRIFDNIYVLTGGANDTASVSILGYDNLFKAFNIGLGSAISVLVFLSVAVIAFIYIKLFGASAPGADNEVR